jgi:hypothetical protein
VVRPTRSNDELADVTGLVLGSAWSLRREAFVDVVVAVENHVGVVLVKEIPERLRREEARALRQPP